MGKKQNTRKHSRRMLTACFPSSGGGFPTPVDADPPPARCRHPLDADPPGHVTCDAGKPTPLWTDRHLWKRYLAVKTNRADRTWWRTPPGTGTRSSVRPSGETRWRRCTWFRPSFQSCLFIYYPSKEGSSDFYFIHFTVYSVKINL